MISVNTKRQADISEFVSSFDGYTRLETSEDCLIDDIDKLKMAGDTIYVSDGNAIYIFERQSGSSLSRIARQGRGPGEYIKLTDFDVFDSKVYVLSSIDGEIIIYNSKGNALKTIDTEYGFRSISVTDEDNIWLYSSDSNDSKYNFVLIDSYGNVKAGYDPFSENQSIIFDNNVFLRQYSDTVYTAKYYDNTVYSLHQDGYLPIYRFDMGLKEMVPQEELHSMLQRDLHAAYRYKETLRQIEHIDRDDNMLFAEIQCFLTGEGLRKCLVKADLGTGKSYSYIAGYSINERFPMFDMSSSIGYDGKTMISCMPASTARECGAKYGIDKLSSISVYDNPVIVFHTLNY